MAIARVGSVDTVTSTSSAGSIASNAFDLAAGNQVVLKIKWEGSEQGISGVTDTAGNEYFPRTLRNHAANSLQAQVWYCPDTLANAANVVTVAFVATPNYRSLETTQLAGGDTAAFYVAESAGESSSSGTAVDVDAAFNAGDFAVAIAADFSSSPTFTWDAGWTEVSDVTAVGFHTAERLDSPGGTYSAGGDLSAAAAWLIVAASFKAAGGSPATVSAPTATPGSTTATVGATTDQNTGTLYVVVDTAANLSGVTATQIKAGQKAGGSAALASGNASVSTTTPSVSITGISATTLYRAAIVQNNANGDSNVTTVDFYTTGAVGTLGQWHPDLRIQGWY